jgi:ribosomal protein S18 acetylase RimI-like enzyme
MIKRVSLQDDFEQYAGLLNAAFATIADDFGLTKENCPTNNAFITAEALKAQSTEYIEFYYYLDQANIAGFIAIEKSKRETGLFYIEKVAAHPGFRHKGIGKQLMNFATERIKESGGNKISVGLINSNTILKDWYRHQGYKETGIKTFEHLPFDVCYMEKELSL